MATTKRVTFAHPFRAVFIFFDRLKLRPPIRYSRDSCSLIVILQRWPVTVFRSSPPILQTPKYSSNYPTSAYAFDSVFVFQKFPVTVTKNKSRIAKKTQSSTYLFWTRAICTFNIRISDTGNIEKKKR